MKKLLLSLALLLALSISFTSCRDTKKSADDAVENVGDAMDDAADAVEETAEDAGDAVDNAIDAVGDAVDATVDAVTDDAANEVKEATN